MAKTFRTYLPEQNLLLPASLREWLPDDHLAYWVSDVVDQLDGPAIVARAEKVLSQAVGSGRPGSQMMDQNIYFEAGIIDRSHADPALNHDVHAAILSVPGI